MNKYLITLQVLQEGQTREDARACLESSLKEIMPDTEFEIGRTALEVPNEITFHTTEED
ncbi:hypothetical protein ACFL1X_05400 [Candidatus Hydrogenedentota bacterium]